MIALVWTTQSWYPLLLQLLVDKPILLPTILLRKDNLVFQPHSQTLHPMKDHLVLAAYKLSGNPLEREAFVIKQLVPLLHLGRRGPINNTIQHGNSGVAGVHRGKLILFNHL